MPKQREATGSIGGTSRRKQQNILRVNFDPYWRDGSSEIGTIMWEPKGGLYYLFFGGFGRTERQDRTNHIKGRRRGFMFWVAPKISINKELLEWSVPPHSPKGSRTYSPLLEDSLADLLFPLTRFLVLDGVSLSLAFLKRSVGSKAVTIFSALVL